MSRIKDTIKGSAGAVSLGSDTTTRQLTNLAPGSADSDAVNVAQLKAVVGSIKKYTVTSPDGSITVTSPTSGQDPQNFQISMNTTAVKDAAAWKIKANKEADDKATSVRGGDIVTFKAKDGGNSGDTIKISRNGKELTFEANYATIRTPDTGAVNVDNGVKDNWLAKAKNVAEAINASGWTLQANGNKVGLVNPGDKVNIATDANSGITITPTNENAGVSTIKLKANVTGLTAGENITISNNNGNYTINAKDTNTQASVSKKSGYIVRVQDIETDNFIVVSVYCDSCIGLLFEKSISCFFCQVFFLWECYTILYHLIPYCNSCCYVFCLIFSDYNTHSSVLHFPYHTVNDQFSVSLHTSAHCLVLFALETWDLLDSIKIPESSPCFRIIFAVDRSACYRMKFDFCSI